MNVGKNFERQLQKSTPKDVLFYRISDSAQSFGGSSSVRFTSKNPFDFLMFDPVCRILFAIEAKSVSGKSISFERCKDDKANIHFHQIDGLKKWNAYKGVECGFIIEFRQIDTTIYIDIKNFLALIDAISKASFTVNDLIANDIEYCIIPQKKLRTNYKYDIRKMIEYGRKKLEDGLI